MRATLGISTGLLLSGTIVALVFAYLVRFFAISFMPQRVCQTGTCVKSAGNMCMQGERPLIGYKLVVGFDS